MAMTVEQRKAARLEGMHQMSFVRKLHRAQVNGKPPASEFRTPTAAVAAARSLYNDLERKLSAEGLKPKPGELGVFVGYVPPDLSLLGFTILYSPGNEAALMESLNGNIMLGLVFGILDRKADNEEDRFVIGTRPFVSMKQVDEWLNELIPLMRMSMGDKILDSKIQEQR